MTLPLTPPDSDYAYDRAFGSCEPMEHWPDELIDLFNDWFENNYPNVSTFEDWLEYTADPTDVVERWVMSTEPGEEWPKRLRPILDHMVRREQFEYIKLTGSLRLAQMWREEWEESKQTKQEK